MSFAEIVLRLGVFFVSWILIYLHMMAIWIVTLAQCPGGDTSPWTMSFLTSLLALGASLALPYGYRLPVMERTMRMAVLPLLVLIPWGIWTVWPYFSGTTIDMAAFCTVRLGTGAGELLSVWPRLWAPLQLLTFVAIALGAWRVWHLRNPAQSTVR